MGKERPPEDFIKDTTPEARADQKSFTSMLWLIPLAAAVIGVFLVYKFISTHI